ncbi:hypothetical protein [Streptomyces cylindrosporus]|uniref:Uncharacterized protein n=1 Tax=Streptomyces cylindrosporus TaxID=2927583 RepID=A0ABS9YGD3_9ACTN|nr:hypothetical protein [Streptomyces cylindrosporus]MCI3276291.1 hypothetical protein [Streptomyces cylindrosporus]
MSPQRGPEKPPYLKSGRPRLSPAAPDGGRGTKSDGRQAVLSAIPPGQNSSDPSAGDGRYFVAWLHICAPYGATPTATSTCLCGRDRSAVGHRKVLALIADHQTHRDECPLRTTQERRNAA